LQTIFNASDIGDVAQKSSNFGAKETLAASGLPDPRSNGRGQDKVKLKSSAIPSNQKDSENASTSEDDEVNKIPNT
jgi:hypothetical protein